MQPFLLAEQIRDGRIKIQAPMGDAAVAAVSGMEIDACISVDWTEASTTARPECRLAMPGYIFGPEITRRGAMVATYCALVKSS